jgi:hypothetical protein
MTKDNNEATIRTSCNKPPITTGKPIKRHGGPGRGQGRKPLKEDGPMIVVALRVTHSQREKINRLGGAKWVRDLIDNTPEPTEIFGQEQDKMYHQPSRRT